MHYAAGHAAYRGRDFVPAAAAQHRVGNADGRHARRCTFVALCSPVAQNARTHGIEEVAASLRFRAPLRLRMSFCVHADPTAAKSWKVQSFAIRRTVLWSLIPA